MTSFQRSFTPQLRRLAESSRRLRLFDAQISALQPALGVPPLSAVPPFTMTGPRAQNAFDELDGQLKEHEKRLAEMNRSWEELGNASRSWRRSAAFCARLRASLMRPSTGIPRSDRRLMTEMALHRCLSMPPSTALCQARASLASTSSFVSGNDRAQQDAHFRADSLARPPLGNLYMNYSGNCGSSTLRRWLTRRRDRGAFCGPYASGRETHKTCSSSSPHGEELLAKIRKVAESMGATMYTIDSSQDKRADALREVGARLEDVDAVLYNMGQSRRVELSKVAEQLEAWKGRRGARRKKSTRRSTS